ncbi:spectrin alpha chain, non-erythrocytic 1 isoform X2 [Hydra vulgaris]|uniref:Spectrin alpha chain, non-erythrocytic 1 isoform X2 n=1 Tax=Hydra vulgaris TaxID=6087 RepID=A0ABM4BDV0_HYDVU
MTTEIVGNRTEFPEQGPKREIKLLETVEDIQKRREQVLRRYGDFKQATKERRKRLEDAKLLCQFKRDSDEVEVWIEEKIKVASDQSFKEPINLQVKLQKHTTFEAEVKAHLFMIETIESKGMVMVNENHYASDYVIKRIDELKLLWSLLLQQSQEKSYMLLCTQSRVNILFQIDELLYWIIGKESIVAEEEPIRDLEHVQLLQKNFDAFHKDLLGNEVRITEVNEICKKLCEEKHPDIQEILAKCEKLNSSWNTLMEHVQEKNKKLMVLFELYRFYRDVDESLVWMSEKNDILSNPDIGDDLQSVTALQRKHETLERDLAALSVNVSILNNEASDLKKKYFDAEKTIIEKENELTLYWKNLQEKAFIRKKNLADSFYLHKFLSESRDYQSFVNDMVSMIKTDKKGSDVESAKALQEMHDEHKGYIDASEDGFEKTIALGKKIIEDEHCGKPDVENEIAILQKERQKVIECWVEKKKEYDQGLDFQLFMRDADQMESIMVKQENFLCSEPDSDSVDGADKLKKKQEEFENALQTQEEKIEAIIEFADRLASQNHSAIQEIKTKQEHIINRRNRLWELASLRRSKLGDSSQFYQFEREAEETKIWLQEKLKVAQDECFRDPINLQGKIQKQHAFLLELNANKSRIDSVKERGHELIDSAHYAKNEILTLINEVEMGWEEVNLKAEEKTQRLSEANLEQQFVRSIEDFEMWLGETEMHLESDDLGKNLASVKNLQKKLNMLEADVLSHKEPLQVIKETASQFIANNHFNSEAILIKQASVADRYSRIDIPLHKRKTDLENSRKYHQLLHDIEDEESWIKEKEPIVSSLHTGKDLIGAQNLLKKHQALVAEISLHEKDIAEVCLTGNNLVKEGHYAREDIKTNIEYLSNLWNDLKNRSDLRMRELLDAIETHQYIADADDAESWIIEKEPLASNSEYGKDEDTAQAMLKKHKALMADIEAFSAIINVLNEQSQKCKPFIFGDLSNKEVVEVIQNYDEKNPHEISIEKGQILTLLNSSNREWWKVESDDRQGFVPKECLQKVDSFKASQDILSNITETESITSHQEKLNKRYNALTANAQQRNIMLQESIKKNAMLRKVKQIQSWIQDSEAVIMCSEVGVDMDDVEALQKKYDEFEKNMVAQEQRITELQLLCSQLKEENASEYEKVNAVLENVSQQWGKMLENASQRKKVLESSSEIHKFHRDADDAKAWIDEKGVSLSSIDYGKDLASVQSLQRKHEVLERDLAALEEKVNSLNAEAGKLMDNHLTSADLIKEKLNDLTENWSELKRKANERKAKLNESYAFQKFLNDYRDQLSWIQSINSLVSSDDLASDVVEAEAMLDRHQEHRFEMDSHELTFDNFNAFGEKLMEEKHCNSLEIAEKIQEIKKSREHLEILWNKRKKTLDENMDEMLFNRDAELAESWMAARETSLKNEDNESTDVLMKKQKDFEKAIAIQEGKIQVLQQTAEDLINANHYNNEIINSRIVAVMTRWETLKEALVDRRSKLGESQSLQSVSKDLDDIESWISEKLQSALDESYMDPSNIQGKLQKHQALEAEVSSNKDRVLSTVSVGNGLIKQNKCKGSEEHIKERLDNIESTWRTLCECCKIKTKKLLEASEQQAFSHDAQDLGFWLGEIEKVLSSPNCGSNLSDVQNLLKKHQFTEADILAHEERVVLLQVLCKHFVEVKHFDASRISETTDNIVMRFNNLKILASNRKNMLESSFALYQYYRDIDDQESWIRVKKVLASSQDYGQDVTSCQNLQKKAQRLIAEIKTFEPQFEQILSKIDYFKEKEPTCTEKINARCEQLKNNWNELTQLANNRNKLLVEAQEYQQIVSDIHVEFSWIAEKQKLVLSEDYGDTLAAIQGLLKKQEAFCNDLCVHQVRFENIQKQVKKLIEENNFKKVTIKEKIDELSVKIAALDKDAGLRQHKLNDNNSFLQFKWKADVAESWIEEKEKYLKVDHFAKDLFSAQNLITRQDAFEAGLSAFELDGIARITVLKEELVSSQHEQSTAIVEAHKNLLARWHDLLNNTAKLRQSLIEQQKYHQMIEDLFLIFAKKASAFNSWFENAEEDLTDPVRCNSVEQIKELLDSHSAFRNCLSQPKADFAQLIDLDSQIKAYNINYNPYTWFDMEALEETWKKLQETVKDREVELEKEARRQDFNDELRQLYASKANLFHKFLEETKELMVDLSGSLEDQLKTLKNTSNIIQAKRDDLDNIEILGAQLEEAMILDNKYTEHSIVGLAQQFDQLNQLNMRMQQNLDHQIQAKNRTGVSEEKLKEFTSMFKHFDKDRTGFLEHQEFKSCLRSLGYNLPLVEEGADDPEFNSILFTVDPNNDGVVSLNEYIAFMISRETENVKSAKEVDEAFRAITDGGKQIYVTEQELYQALTREQAEFCMSRMKTYVDKNGRELPGYFDYGFFCEELFVA